jgi:hypothetical protein
MADEQVATTRWNANLAVFEGGRQRDVCQNAAIAQCVLVVGGKKKACERCSRRKKPCE